MKKLRFVAGALTLFTAIGFVSCSSDDDATPTPTPTPEPVTVSTGDYWPMAIDNQWNYNLNGTPEDPTKIVSMDHVDGHDWFTLAVASPDGAAGTERIRKENGNYYLTVGDVTATSGGVDLTVTGNTTTILKDYKNVGETWTDSYTQITTYTGIPPISSNITVTCTMLERDGTLIVNGVTYTNVLKVQRQLAVNTSGSTSSINSYYWYAKDKGPIKIEIISPSSPEPSIQEVTSISLH